MGQTKDKHPKLVFSGHLRHDYLIKYAYFEKCYLQRFAPINDPEN